MTIRTHQRFTHFSSALLIAIACGVVGLAVPALAGAATYTVGSTDDQPDQTPGDEICATAGDTCTLRAAIQEANADGGEDEIVFGPTFDGELADTINLGSALPAIEVPTVTIDGESAGACATAAGRSGPCVGVDGPTGRATLEAKAVQVTVEGLALTGATTGVKATAAGKELVVGGNWIGTKLDGTAAADTTGIDVVGPTILEANEISGGQVGIHTGGNDASGGSEIAGNLIDGTLGSAILIENDSNLVVGNQVSGAGAAGIRIHSGTGSIADENVIGGATPDPSAPDPAENIIDDSAGAAIEINTVEGSEANRVLRNSGSGNTAAFIKLVKASPAEAKAPNNGIQPPVIRAVTSTEVSGTAQPEDEVRLFRKASAEPGELGSFLGVAAADSSGGWTITSPTLFGGASKVIVAASQTPEEEEKGTSELGILTAELAPFKVQKAGTGSGSVVGALGQIDCGATCEALFFGQLRLTGTPAADSNPVAWSGCDAIVGTDECEVTLSAAKQVTATFDLTPTCAIDPSLCPPASGGSSDSGSSSSSSSSSSSPPPSQPQPKKPLKCKAGFKKTKVKGVQHCVKVRKHHKHS